MADRLLPKKEIWLLSLSEFSIYAATIRDSVRIALMVFEGNI